MRSQFNQQGHQGEYRRRKTKVDREEERWTSFVVDIVAFAVRNDHRIGHRSVFGLPCSS
jgi:hypothetical protein